MHSRHEILRTTAALPALALCERTPHFRGMNMIRKREHCPLCSVMRMCEQTPQRWSITRRARGSMGLWKRPEPSPLDRSVVTVAALIACIQTIEMALDNGVKPSELSEIITHLAFYSGWANVGCRGGERHRSPARNWHRSAATRQGEAASTE